MEKTKQVSWDDIELGDLTVSPLHQPTSLVGLNHVDIHHDDENPDRGRGVEHFESDELRQRRTTPSPGRHDQHLQQKDVAYATFIDLLEHILKDKYRSTNLRNADQLYFDMIPDTIIQKDTRNGELFTTLVYWIKTEHIYWKVLDTNYKDACVVAKMDTGPKSALLAIDRAHMDGVIIKMWDLLYSNNRTYRILNLDQ